MDMSTPILSNGEDVKKIHRKSELKVWSQRAHVACTTM